MVNPSPPPPRTILVIDDDPDVLDMIEELLTGEGYAVATATTARAGLDQAQATPPDLIFMDAALPDMKGEAAVQALKGDAATRAIPVVALTGSINPGALVAAGCLACIPKPFDATAFVRLIAELAPGADRRAAAARDVAAGYRSGISAPPTSASARHYSAESRRSRMGR